MVLSKDASVSLPQESIKHRKVGFMRVAMTTLNLGRPMGDDL